MSSYDADLLYFGGSLPENKRIGTSIIMDGHGERCVWCTKICNESCLQMSNTFDGNIVFCGECVYNNHDITRPSSNITQHRFEVIRKENERIAKENEERERIRKRTEFLTKFCCKRFGKLIMASKNFNGLEITETGRLKFINIEVSDDYGWNKRRYKAKKYGFKYCPYCRKEFIRENKK